MINLTELQKHGVSSPIEPLDFNLAPCGLPIRYVKGAGLIAIDEKNKKVYTQFMMTPERAQLIDDYLLENNW